MRRLVGIAEAARAIGVSPITLRRWETEGKLQPCDYTEGGHRRYDLYALKPAHSGDTRYTLAYAYVPSPDYVAELEHQKLALQAYCDTQGWPSEVITDIGSGMYDRKNGIRRLLQAILDKQVERLVLARKDRLPHFGAEIAFSVCAAQNVEVVILNRPESSPFKPDLTASEAQELVTTLRAPLYARSRRPSSKRPAKARTPVVNGQHINEEHATC